MIEESYLLGLSEQEIRQDFKRFIDACYAVIHENVKDREVVTGLAENLAREQTVILIADRSDGSTAAELAEEAATGSRATSEDFCEKVARRKRQILRTIAKYDPELVRLIDEHRFQGEIDEPSRPVFRRPFWRLRWSPDWSEIRLRLLKVGYATTIGLIILLIWLGFIQK